jgi:hypothetical protein
MCSTESLAHRELADQLAGQPLDSNSFKLSASDCLPWIHFASHAKLGELVVQY